MKQSGSKPVRGLKHLTDREKREEVGYRSQLRSSWSFVPGEHPADVWEREHAEEDE